MVYNGLRQVILLDILPSTEWFYSKPKVNNAKIVKASRDGRTGEGVQRAMANMQLSMVLKGDAVGAQEIISVRQCIFQKYKQPEIYQLMKASVLNNK